MRCTSSLLLIGMLMFCGKAFALGIDVGPVHVHGTKVKVGENIDLKIVPDKLVKDDDNKDRIRKIEGHRKGDNDDKFTIKVVWSDLDDDSKELLAKAETDKIYRIRLKKLDDDWQLVRIRKDDGD